MHVESVSESRSAADVWQAVEKEDDWTGVTDAASRRKRQNRLNVRAYRRRRRAIQAQAHTTNISPSSRNPVNTENEVACWVEDQQTISFFPLSVAKALKNLQDPIIPPSSPNVPSASRVVFPLTSDHLIPLLQFNVLRACLTNRQLISRLQPVVQGECSTAALHVLPSHTLLDSIPPSLQPTLLQATIPHEGWIDILPHPIWRDNVILAIGTFDEDALWSDTIGRLFEGFPASEIEQRGVIAWNPPWDVSGWEVSEGFWRKWGWLFSGCGEMLEITNRWRRVRGEEPLRI